MSFRQSFDHAANGQGGHPQPPPPPAGAKATKCKGRPVPQLEDVTAKFAGRQEKWKISES